jgi:GAF domain-containing protein
MKEENSNIELIEQLAKKLDKSDSLLKAISKIQGMFISRMSSSEIFDEILSTILEQCDSEYGFIGEVRKKDDVPFLKTFAITNISWNEDTRKFYEENSPEGLEFVNLKSLFGVTIETGEIVISNDPANDERKAGLPEGHPALNHYLGVPLKHEGKMIGMFGISNREGGYSMEIVEQIQPLINTAGQIIAAKKRADKDKDLIQELKDAIKSIEE